MTDVVRMDRELFERIILVVLKASKFDMPRADRPEIDLDELGREAMEVYEEMEDLIDSLDVENN